MFSVQPAVILSNLKIISESKYQKIEKILNGEIKPWRGGEKEVDNITGQEADYKYVFFMVIWEQKSLILRMYPLTREYKDSFLFYSLIL